MKTLMMVALLTISSWGYGDWVRMVSVGTDYIDYKWRVCTYQAIYSSFTIEITTDEYCPRTIKYNPRTGYWKK